MNSDMIGPIRPQIFIKSLYRTLQIVYYPNIIFGTFAVSRIWMVPNAPLIGFPINGCVMKYTIE